MDKLTQNNVLIGVAVLVVIFIIYKLFLQSYFFPPAKFMPYDRIHGPGRINATPSYIYQMNKYGSLDDPLTTAANEGIKFSRHADFDRSKYEGVGMYDLKYLNKMENTQNLAAGDIAYDIYGGFLPPVDIVSDITMPGDSTSPSLSSTPAPIISAITPTEAVVVPAINSAASGSTAISVSNGAPGPAVTAPPPAPIMSQPMAKETSAAPSRFSMF